MGNHNHVAFSPISTCHSRVYSALPKCVSSCGGRCTYDIQPPGIPSCPTLPLDRSVLCATGHALTGHCLTRLAAPDQPPDNDPYTEVPAPGQPSFIPKKCTLSHLRTYCRTTRLPQRLPQRSSSLTADAVHSAGCHTDSRTRSGRKMKSDRPPVTPPPPPPRTCTMSWPCNYACLAHCRHRERDSGGWMGGPGVGCPAASTCCGMRGICGDVISTSIGLHRALR